MNWNPSRGAGASNSSAVLFATLWTPGSFLLTLFIIMEKEKYDYLYRGGRVIRIPITQEKPQLDVHQEINRRVIELVEGGLPTGAQKKVLNHNYKVPQHPHALNMDVFIPRVKEAISSLLTVDEALDETNAKIRTVVSIIFTHPNAHRTRPSRLPNTLLRHESRLQPFTAEYLPSELHQDGTRIPPVLVLQRGKLTKTEF